MFTTIDKAIAAIIFGILSIVQIMTGWGIDSIGLTPDVLTVIINAVVGPLAVYLVPNKPAA